MRTQPACWPVSKMLHKSRLNYPVYSMFEDELFQESNREKTKQTRRQRRQERQAHGLVRAKDNRNKKRTNGCVEVTVNGEELRQLQ